MSRSSRGATVRSFVAKDTVSAVVKPAREIDESASDVVPPDDALPRSAKRLCQGHGVSFGAAFEGECRVGVRCRSRFWRGSLRNGYHFWDAMVSHPMASSRDVAERRCQGHGVSYCAARECECRVR